MRKLKSKQEIEKKQKKNQIILGILLIVVMFGSVFGVIVGSFGEKNSSSNIQYKGYEFKNQNNYWYTQIGNLEFLFKYFPDEKENNIKTEMDSLAKYSGQQLYIYSENYESEIEIYRNIYPIVQRMQYACLNKEKCNGDYPIKTCEDNFIIIQESLVNEIYQEENCVFIQGEKEKLPELTDEFLFNIIGIQ
jgi:hypothetical protein